MTLFLYKVRRVTDLSFTKIFIFIHIFSDKNLKLFPFDLKNKTCEKEKHKITMRFIFITHIYLRAF